MTIEEMLDEYGMIKAQVDLINMDRDAKRAIIQASIQAELDALEAEYKPLTATADKKLAELEAGIKEATLKNGGTVKGTFFQAVFVQPSAAYDTNALDGLAVV